jgi:superoxide dismutase, Cu-Zn family
MLWLMASACEQQREEERPEEAPQPEVEGPADLAPRPLAGVERLVAVLSPAEGKTTRGKVRFEQLEQGVRVTAEVEGLEPGGTHGFHVHELGDCSDLEAHSMGDHYNPLDVDHALPPQVPRHAGDLGNLKADDEGKAMLEMTVATMHVVGEPDPIIGRAVVVHERRDDGSQPDGDAGDPIACGVAGVAGGNRSP